MTRPALRMVIVVAALAGCMAASDLDRPEVQPMVAAINASRRAELGFSPLPATHPVRIERATAVTRGYDVMLHLYWPNGSETIGLTDSENGYTWVFDQEIHVGPRQYDHPDGPLNEQITITYSVPDATAETRRRNGMPPGLLVTYDGPDEELRRESTKQLGMGTAQTDGARRMLRRLAPLIRQWNTIRE